MKVIRELYRSAAERQQVGVLINLCQNAISINNSGLYLQPLFANPKD